uniref:plectin-like isoform X2 n=1 Tax=Ciona intestinalis TaxID=7719 RepID=UPI000EF458D2|nr:plectin-like isoform X2 [Ciona intestinalis]|eukprot:XP_026689825.1 plectin-like isoform X2 [Ciona intestinalis]
MEGGLIAITAVLAALGSLILLLMLIIFFTSKNKKDDIEKQPAVNGKHPNGKQPDEDRVIEVEPLKQPKPPDEEKQEVKTKVEVETSSIHSSLSSSSSTSSSSTSSSSTSSSSTSSSSTSSCSQDKVTTIDETNQEEVREQRDEPPIVVEASQHEAPKEQKEEKEEPEEKEKSSSSSSSKEEDEQPVIAPSSPQKPATPCSSSSDDNEVVLEPSTKETSSSLSSDTLLSSSSSSEEENEKEKTEEKPIKQTSVSKIVESFDQAQNPPEKPLVAPKRRSRKDVHFTSGWKRRVTLDDLYKAGVVDETTLEQIEAGKIEESSIENSLKLYLVGEEPIAGLIMSDTGEKISIYDAWKTKSLIRKGNAISLLEAQAATGRVIDPCTAQRMSVQEASDKGLIDKQFETVLLRAERAVYGYKTKLSTETLSLFEAMKRGLVVENHGIRLLEAQIATGGIVDPNANHRLPVEVAYERGLFDKRLNDILQDPSDDTKGFFDPTTQENLSYLELMKRCVIDKDTGLRLLPFRVKKKTDPRPPKIVFHSESKRPVTLQDVVDAELIDAETAERFDTRRMLSYEVKDMIKQLRVYVDGKPPIAGVLNRSTGEKMSIQEASRAGLIRKGTAFELLEAQAACGKIIDVQSGKTVTIETALKTGLIDREYEDVVSKAGQAVTGYRDPFKHEALSLCEAMGRHQVVERHGIRLLEAQLATGGIIDPKSPVRISAAVALKRGLIDRNLASQLDQRETSSYVHPLTGENLNYSVLMERCTTFDDMLLLPVETGTVTPNVLPFEPKPSGRKIREKSPSPSKPVVKAKRKKKSSMRGSRPSSPTSRRVVIVDPNSGNELTVQEALKFKLIDEQTAAQLMAEEGDFEEDEDGNDSLLVPGTSKESK